MAEQLGFSKGDWLRERTREFFVAKQLRLAILGIQPRMPTGWHSPEQNRGYSKRYKRSRDSGFTEAHYAGR